MTATAPKPRCVEGLLHSWNADKYVCLGLDSDIRALPAAVGVGQASPSAAQRRFNREIVEATSDQVCAYKLNLAFYLEQLDGLGVLVDAVADIHARAPGVPVILDGKFGDIGNSSAAYARFAFDVVDADAVTVSPYVGGDGIAPFTERADRGVFVLVRTSNPGSAEFQVRQVDRDRDGPALALYEAVAMAVSQGWNAHDNCGLVVGATAVPELARIRALVPELPILLPGVGTQGGDLRGSLLAGRNAAGQGLLINLSRAVIFASSNGDFASRARDALLGVNQEVQAILHEDRQTATPAVEDHHPRRGQ